MGDIRVIGHWRGKVQGALPTVGEVFVVLQQFGDPFSRPLASEAQAVDDAASDDNCLPVAERFIGLRKGNFEKLPDLAGVMSLAGGDGDSPDPGDAAIFLLGVVNR